MWHRWCPGCERCRQYPSHSRLCWHSRILVRTAGFDSPGSSYNTNKKLVQRKQEWCHNFKDSPYWLDQTVAEFPQRFVFVWSDAVSDHAFELIPGWQQTVIVQGEAGTLSRTVLNVVGFIQHQDLAWQVDIHLEKTLDAESHFIV